MAIPVAQNQPTLSPTLVAQGPLRYQRARLQGRRVVSEPTQGVQTPRGNNAVHDGKAAVENVAKATATSVAAMG